MKKICELTNVEELIEELKKLPPKTEIYVAGTNGYMYYNEKENYVVFDDLGCLGESED